MRATFTKVLLVSAAVVSGLAQSSELNDRFISDGSAVSVEKLGIKINPPKGWEVITSSPSLSLVLQEQAPKKIVYDKAIFQRNITVAAVHQPAPIDDQRAIQLKEELKKTIGKTSGLVENFQIVEHRFFDYRGKNDGLVVYNTFDTGEFPMMQMHILVSGEAKQFLLSYTDLRERFSDRATYDLAWTSMSSIEVTGKAPVRNQDVLFYGMLAAALLLGFAVVSKLRNHRPYGAALYE